MRSTIIRCLVIAGIPIGAATMIAAPAHAATTEAPAQVVVSPMHIVGYDRAVAAAHGYEIRVGANGQEYSVKQGEVTPYNTIPGDCGKSWVYIYPKGGHKADIDTGFDVNTPAVDFSWDVRVHDDWGTSIKSWGHVLLAQHNWEGVNHFKSSGAGYVDARVISGFAILANGGVCYSEGPSDTEYVS